MQRTTTLCVYLGPSVPTWDRIWAAFFGSTMRTCSKCFRVCCLSFCSARTYFFSMLNTWRGCGGKKRKQISRFVQNIASSKGFGSEVPLIHPMIWKDWESSFCNSLFYTILPLFLMGNYLVHWPPLFLIEYLASDMCDACSPKSILSS